MSDRALVARSRDDGRYDLLCGTWAPGSWRVSAETPVATVGSAAAARRHVRFGVHEALVLADDPGRVLVALPFGVPDPRGDGGALVEIRDATDAAYVQGWCRGFRAALVAATDRSFPVDDARRMLVEEARGWGREDRTVHLRGASGDS